MKKCSKCKVNKSVSEFYKNSKTKSGLKAQCKTCCANKPKRASFVANELSPESEALANRRAIEKLIKAHPNEYFTLLTKERTKI